MCCQSTDWIGALKPFESYPRLQAWCLCSLPQFSLKATGSHQLTPKNLQHRALISCPGPLLRVSLCTFGLAVCICQLGFYNPHLRFGFLRSAASQVLLPSQENLSSPLRIHKDFPADIISLRLRASHAPMAVHP